MRAAELAAKQANSLNSMPIWAQLYLTAHGICEEAEVITYGMATVKASENFEKY